MNLVERAKALILTPSAEWDKIDGETHTVQGLYTEWIMILAAIPALAGFVGHSIVGVGVFGVSYRTPVVTGIAVAIVSYAVSLAMVFVLAHVIDALAPSFDGQKNFGQAFKVAAFAPVASWLAGIFSLIPMLSILGIVGLYSLYLLWVGLPKLMKVPPNKAPGYVVVVVIVAIVISVILGAITAVFGAARAF